jgi:hypothetical protein
LVEEDDNKALYGEILINELQVIIGTFKRDKILGPDGWNVDFYKDFFELLGEDLLKV